MTPLLTGRQIDNLLAQLKDKTILVAGDYFLDRYLIIDAARDELSLETNLVAYQVVGQRISPGAAGTITNNLRALGVGKVLALGFTGDDGEGYELRRALKQSGVDITHLLVDSRRVTPTYCKPMRKAGDEEKEINRLDIKNWTATPIELQEHLIENMFALAGSVDAVIVLDQVTEMDCGVVTQLMRSAIGKLSTTHPHLPILVDSRRHINSFRSTIIKCNAAELMGSRTVADRRAVQEAALALAAENKRPAFITIGEAGQLVAGDGVVQVVPAIPVAGPVDTVGAGDATMAGITCSLICGFTPEQAAYFGNLVASITIKKLGVTGTASPEEIRRQYAELCDLTG